MNCRDSLRSGLGQSKGCNLASKVIVLRSWFVSLVEQAVWLRSMSLVPGRARAEAGCSGILSVAKQGEELDNDVAHIRGQTMREERTPAAAGKACSCTQQNGSTKTLGPYFTSNRISYLCIV